MPGEDKTSVCAVCGRTLYRPNRCRKCGKVLCQEHSSRRKHECLEPSEKRVSRSVMYLLVFAVAAIVIVAGMVAIMPRTGSVAIVWGRTYGDNMTQEAYHALRTDDGMIVVAENEGRLSMMNLNDRGDLIWENTHSMGPPYHIIDSGEGGFLVSGDDGDCVRVLKTDSEGVEIWSKSYTSEKSLDHEALSISRVEDGGCLVSGTRFNFTDKNYDAFLWKIDNEGNKTHEMVFSGYTPWITSSGDGNFVVVSVASSAEQEYRIRLFKIDSEGNHIWDRFLDSVFPNHDGIWLSSIVDINGGFLVTGTTDLLGAGDDDVYLVRVDVEGKQVWERTYGTKEVETGESAAQSSDGGFLIAGWARRAPREEAVPRPIGIYLLRVDTEGNQIWEERLGKETGKLTQGVHSIIWSGDAEYIIVGWKDKSRWGVQGNPPDAYILKIRDKQLSTNSKS